VPDDALRVFRTAIARGAESESDWRHRVVAHQAVHPQVARQWTDALAGTLPEGWAARLPAFTVAAGEMATRDAGAAVVTALMGTVSNLIGGSADLDPSTRTTMAGCGDFESPLVAESLMTPPTQGTAGGVWGYAGRNVHFGLREHAMAAIATGLALHGGLRPFTATFLSFSDYMRPSIRLAALSQAPVIYVWTHDSLALGEDGPTHQPIEQLAGLRAMPNLLVIRPSDATETVEAWRVALQHTDGPVALVLTRQALPVLDRTVLGPAAGLSRGAYVLADSSSQPPEIILIATGSEVSIALEAHAELVRAGLRSRVVSMPCWELFDKQAQTYRDRVLPPSVWARVSIEAASSFGWERYVGSRGAMIGVDRFGESAPGPRVMREFGFTAEQIVQAAKGVLARKDAL
jgi:transketolase